MPGFWYPIIQLAIRSGRTLEEGFGKYHEVKEKYDKTFGLPEDKTNNFAHFALMHRTKTLSNE